MARLDDKVIVVTGAGRGLGRAYCLALAREGATVVVAELNEGDAKGTQAAVEELGGRAMVCLTDVRDESSVLAMRDAAVRDLGGIDGLINNAGVLTRMPMDRTTKRDWDNIFDTNVWGSLICARAMVPSMVQRGGGSIINIGSSTFLSPAPGYTAYMASKGALVALTRSLAKDLGPHNIRVNAILPALTVTPGMAVETENLEAYMEERLDLQMIRRRPQPEDVAGAAIFLLSDESAFVTGQCLPVTGGAGMV